LTSGFQGIAGDYAGARTTSEDGPFRTSHSRFNTTFETVVGIDDFAIRAHFVGDLLCKIHEGGRFIASYATTMPIVKMTDRSTFGSALDFELHSQSDTFFVYSIIKV
uniref:Beta-lactamase domain-containing protein n=1 Tax=Angiostrongylus cantonensis TaxID=6313 RepID=A0A0K0D2A6_ANGCA